MSSTSRRTRMIGLVRLNDATETLIRLTKGQFLGRATEKQIKKFKLDQQQDNDVLRRRKMMKIFDKAVKEDKSGRNVNDDNTVNKDVSKNAMKNHFPSTLC